MVIVELVVECEDELENRDIVPRVNSRRDRVTQLYGWKYLWESFSSAGLSATVGVGEVVGTPPRLPSKDCEARNEAMSERKRGLPRSAGSIAASESFNG